MSSTRGAVKTSAINAIKRNLNTLNSVVLLIVFTLLFLNVRFIYNILDYVPSVSIVTMLTIVSGLILISLYLSKNISRKAILKLEEYDHQLNNTMTSMEQEIKERKLIEKQLEHQLHYDKLTGLPNRTLFTKRLNRVHTRPQKHDGYMFAVILLDLDGFKVVNDSMGHLVGDKLIVMVARRLETCVRSIDTVARFAGDEFAILLDDINDDSDTLHLAKRIQKQLKIPFDLDGQDVFISASIGIVLNTTAYDQEEDFLRDADIAMYHAKLNGRARFEMFDSQMYDSIMKRVNLEADLRLAIEREEFIVHYQPIISVAEQRITAVEALIRWQHPQKGLISPLEFIPLAEDTGLISLIGEWVLKTACAQNKAWHDKGHKDLHVEVNFSASQFKHQDISKLVDIVLKETGMNAETLDIEVTESIAMEGHSIEVLNKLSAMGIGTSIDDFGTGYSSLGSLKKFPINALKIDKSFIMDITTDPDVEAIVMAIIAMAHTLKIKVVAEGVETEEQLVLLQAHNCDEIQGYFYSPPMPEDEISKLLKNEQCLSLCQKKPTKFSKD